jgi:hypothetical protein
MGLGRRIAWRRRIAAPAGFSPMSFGLSNRPSDFYDALRMQLCESFNNKIKVIFPPRRHHPLSERLRLLAAQDGQRVFCSAWRRARPERGW